MCVCVCVCVCVILYFSSQNHFPCTSNKPQQQGLSSEGDTVHVFVVVYCCLLLLFVVVYCCCPCCFVVVVSEFFMTRCCLVCSDVAEGDSVLADKLMNVS